MRTWLFILVCLFEIAATPSADSAQYVVEGLALGDRVRFDSSIYQSYTCQPSDEFADLTNCRRTQRRDTSSILSNTIIHTQDGTAIYLMANVAPVSLSRNVVEREIEELSRQIKNRPTRVDWDQSSIIALWGDLKLDNPSSKELEGIEAGGLSPRMGLLVDRFGDTKRSAGDLVYRITGGPGYLYSASFDSSSRGHRRYLAINPLQLAPRQFEVELQVLLEKDRSRAHDDYRLWPEVADITRRLARETSPRIANDSLDKVFAKFSSKKLHSRVWSILPGGVIDHLGRHEYATVDIYGPNTKYPDIRRNIMNFLAASPSEPFVECLYYALGEFDKALQINPNLIIRDVLQYASGHKILEGLLQEITTVVKPHAQDIEDDYACADHPNGVNRILRFLNRNPERYDHKPLVDVVPDFATRSAAAQPYFEAVMRDTASPHADDAAYMLGWLAFHQGKFKEALVYFSQAMVLGNGDYQRPAAMKQVVRTLERNPPLEQVAIVETNSIFAQQPPLLYMAARSAYRDFNYPLAIEAAGQALKMINIPVESLPATTDPKRIEAALDR